MGEALLIVDFQNDFTPGGALAVAGGDEIAGRLNQLASSGRFDLVVATRDWHPQRHGSFVEQGGTWPVHCVQGSHGAELHPALDRSRVDAILDKGEPVDEDGYSAFDGTVLASLLHERGIGRVTIVGLATDYCVKHTALDALAAGFEVIIDESAVRGVELSPGDCERALEEVRAAGASVRSARRPHRT